MRYSSKADSTKYIYLFLAAKLSPFTNSFQQFGISVLLLSCPTDEFNLTLSGPAFFHVWYLSPEASEGLVLNMTIVGYPLKIFLRYITFL